MTRTEPAPVLATPPRARHRMPLQVWLLTVSAFAIGTAEFVIAGLLTTVADDLRITEGAAGWLITAYAAAIMIGGPPLTLWLARFDKKAVLVGLLVLFVGANLLGWATHSFAVLLIARVLAGLVQGPFYGIGSVVATRLVPREMAGRAVGQMFAGLTLANVLGVPAGAWIGSSFGWRVTFLVVAGLGAIAGLAILLLVRANGRDAVPSVRGQLAALRNGALLRGLAITVVGWLGFMTFYGYVTPIAERVAGIGRSWMTVVLVVVGAGLVLGNALGARSADRDLRGALRWWLVAMSASLALVGLVAAWPIAFVVAAFGFGVASFANVPPMQMRVLAHAGGADELVGTLNISAFNLANAAGGIIGGAIVDSRVGPAAVPWAAAALPVAAIALVLLDRRRS